MPLLSVTRASCLDCIEKHLGTAYVLLTETREAYAHRLRTIGHQHVTTTQICGKRRIAISGSAPHNVPI